ncbi:hypothetical protein C1H46_015511 [Malus baccata]|uniref:Reverse transcriptase n=1 Tax=Malus baccata TaxID=106549 RepID=A0A540MJA7_MALBA|nr:hypothetical protein C1H46_015511 [Malus baccata]
MKWSHDKFKNRKKETDRLISQLGHLQRNWVENSNEIGEFTQTINMLEAQEEAYWAVRSRIWWLQAGDLNIDFFHQAIVLRRRSNKLSRIQCEDGSWKVGHSGVRSTMENHFKKLFTSESPRDWGDFFSCLDLVLTTDMNEALCSPISDIEIKDAVFNMGGQQHQVQMASKVFSSIVFGTLSRQK